MVSDPGDIDLDMEGDPEKKMIEMKKQIDKMKKENEELKLK